MTHPPKTRYNWEQTELAGNISRCVAIDVLSIASRVSLSFAFFQLCWWWCLGSAGPRFTLTASCGVSSVTGLTTTGKSLNMCTSSLEYFSTSAQQSTRSFTTSCPRASGKCSRRSCAIGNIISLRENTHSVLPEWHFAAHWATHPTAMEPLSLKLMQRMEKWKWRMRPLFHVKKIRFCEWDILLAERHSVLKDWLVLHHCTHHRHFFSFFNSVLFI